MKSTTNGLRFAAYTRVSTTGQEKDGHSLEQQRKNILGSVKKLSGGVVKWYGGEQEKGTGAKAWPHFDRMLADATLGIFDAIVVDDTFRWSRDEGRDAKAAGILRECGVRLFIKSEEMDLWNPQHRLLLGISSSIGAFSAATNAAKAIRYRIEQAENGYPTCGRSPWGRECTNWHERESGKPAEWKAAPKAVKLAERIYALHVGKGLSWAGVADKLRGDPLFVEMFGGKRGKLTTNAVLANVIRRRMLNAGGEWKQEFTEKGRKISLPYKIEPLLADQQIAEIRGVAAAHKVTKARTGIYLLAKLVKCGNCGGVLSASTHPSGNRKREYRYYNHRPAGFRQGCVKRIDADRLEPWFIHEVGQLLRHDDRLEAAARAAAITDPNALHEVDDELAGVTKRRKELRTVDFEAIMHLGKAGGAFQKEAEARVAAFNAEDLKLEQREIELGAKRRELAARPDLDALVNNAVDSLRTVGRSFHGWPTAAQADFLVWMFGLEGSLKNAKTGIFVKHGRPQVGMPTFEFEARATVGDIRGWMGYGDEGVETGGDGGTWKIGDDAMQALAKLAVQHKVTDKSARVQPVKQLSRR